MRSLWIALALMLSLATFAANAGEKAWDGEWDLKFDDEEFFLDDFLISMELHDVSLSDFLQSVFDDHDIQYIIPSDLGDPGHMLRARFEEMPLGEVLEATLGMFGYAYDVIGENVILVVPMDRMLMWKEAMALEYEADMMEWKMEMEEEDWSHYANMEEMEIEFEQGMEEMQIELAEELVDRAAEGDLSQEEVEEIIAGIMIEIQEAMEDVHDVYIEMEPEFFLEEDEIVTRIFLIQHRDPEDLQHNLTLLLNGYHGSTMISDRHHLIVTAPAERVEVIERILEEIDTP